MRFTHTTSAWKASTSGNCDNTDLMRRVEAGESFVVTRNGRPIADLVPHVREPAGRLTLIEAQDRMRALPPIDVEQWYRDHNADDARFGSGRTAD